MSNVEDHALGLELQLIELVERQNRARVQHREQDAQAVQAEIDALQRELAELAEVAAPPGPGGGVGFRGAVHPAQSVEGSSEGP